MCTGASAALDLPALQLTVRVRRGAYTKNEPAVIGETWTALLELFRTRKMVGAVFDKVFDGLESVPEGLRALGGRETWGKAVVKIKGGREGKL